MSRNTSFISDRNPSSIFVGSPACASVSRERPTAVEVVGAEIPFDDEVDALVHGADLDPVGDVVGAVFALGQAQEIFLLHALHALERRRVLEEARVSS